jgi:hypothetical protein
LSRSTKSIHDYKRGICHRKVDPKKIPPFPKLIPQRSIGKKARKRKEQQTVINLKVFEGSCSNGYALLRMAKYSPDNSEKWLFRARQLANMICSHLEPTIDLLEAKDFGLASGYGGVLSFLIDVCDPGNNEAKMPLFE